MPNRHRSHELETLSQRAFESAMPANLVVRPVSDDYGVDREVEVFDGDSTTGLTFKVQLKGTDKSGTTRRVSRDHVDYWLSLDVPVLLVSYEAGTETLRGRWVHSIDMDQYKSGAATITVHMDPDIDLHGDWPDDLASDLQLIREVRRGRLPKPMPVRVTVEDGSTTASQLQINAALLRASRTTDHPMSNVADAHAAAMSLTITRKRVQCALPLGLASGSLTLKAGMLHGVNAQDIADLGLALAACAIAPIDEALSRAWAQAVSPESPWWGLSDLSTRLIPVLHHPESAAALLNVHLALTLAEAPHADLYLLAVQGLASNIPEDTFQTYSKTIEATLTNDHDGGRRAHNLGQLHRERRDYEPAAKFLRQAAVHAPQYLTNGLYHRHLGTCDWELGNYDDAAQDYRNALANGYDSHEVLPLLADSLMWAGKYADARGALGDWTPAGTREDRLGLIRRVMLDHFATVGLTEQTRTNVEALIDLTDEDRRLKPGVSTDDVLSVAQNGDALHPMVWALMVDPSDLGASFESALIAAALAENFPHGWVVALLCGLAKGCDPAIVTAILDQARFHCGNRFYDAVMEAADHFDAEDADRLREMVSETWVADAESFEYHWRTVDFAQSDWLIEDLTHLGRPLTD